MLRFRGLTLLLDCGLDVSSALSFLPMPLVHSAKIAALASYSFKDENDVTVEWVHVYVKEFGE